MGGMLSEPITTKNSYQAMTEKYAIASSSMQGWRDTMEDAHAIAAGLSSDLINDYFAVFDGHGGTKVADYLSIHLEEQIKNEVILAKGDIKKALEQACLKIDGRMKLHPQLNKDSSGSTAIVVVISKDTLYCANVGDSRAVACVHGGPLPLSVDHKPNLPDEKKRIMAAGGFVAFERVNGILALSRAFGDFDYKKNVAKTQQEQIITSFPDVIEKKMDKHWEFVVIACDGIWDVMSNERVCEFVRQRLDAELEPQVICEELLIECLCKENCGVDAVGTDNTTVILIVLKGSRKNSYLAEVTDTSVPARYCCNQLSIS